MKRQKKILNIAAPRHQDFSIVILENIKLAILRRPLQHLPKRLV